MASTDHTQLVSRSWLRRMVVRRPILAALTIGAVWGLSTGAIEFVLDDGEDRLRRLFVRVALGVLGFGPLIVWFARSASKRPWRGRDTAVVVLLVVIAAAAFGAAIAT